MSKLPTHRGDSSVFLGHKSLFTFHEILGKGRTSEVRKVTQKSTGEEFVMKQLQRPKSLKYFLAETSFLLSTTHENIIKMECAYYDKENYYICTNYCSGKRLLDRATDCLFSEKMAADAMRSILTAIKLCHDKHIVHRDLKLDNVMYDKEGDDGKIVIIDWGFALKIDPSKVYDKMIGTPYYLAPECVGIRQAWELKASDIFAIGVMCYALLTGCFPFEIKNKNDIRKQRKSKIHWTNSNISCDGKNFIESLLDENVYTRLTADEALNHQWIC
jgi:calcium-dependent protein kinase